MQSKVSLANSHDFPKTLIVDLSERFGGASVRVLSLIKKFPADRVSLAVLRDTPVYKEAVKEGLPVVVVGSGKADPRVFLRLVRLVKQNQYEVIDTQNIQSKFWGSLVAVLTDAKLVSTLNSWYASEHGGKNLKSYVYTALELHTNYIPTRYIAVSRAVRDSLQYAGIKADEIELIYNAVEIDPATVRGSKEALLKQFRLPSDVIVCAAVGRLVWAKGFDDLIEAFGLAVRENPKLRCFIAGDGELHGILSARIEKLGLAEYVFLLGYQDHDEALSLIKASDVFIMPSRTEGTPIALLEAAALARPILATNCGGIPELVEDGEHALLIPVGDITALSAGLLRLVDDSALMQRLGEAACQRIKKEFSLSAQVFATRQAYLKALKRK